MDRATRRGIRRAAEKVGAKRPRPISLQPFLSMLTEKKIPASVEGNTRGDKVCVQTHHFGRQVIRTFAHPTKKATLGRHCVVMTAR